MWDRIFCNDPEDRRDSGRKDKQMGTETNPKTLGEGAGTAPPSLSSSLGDDSGGDWLSCPGPRLPLARVPHPLQKCTHSTSLNLLLPLPGLPAPVSLFKAHSPSQIHCLGRLSDLPFHPTILRQSMTLCPSCGTKQQNG